MLKVIHVRSNSERVRLYIIIMYLRQIYLKKIDIHRKKIGDAVYTMTSKIIRIYICTLSRVFDFLYSDILGPLTVCANKKESSPRS